MAYEILIAEDDPVLRDVYIRKFRGDRFHVRTAENGEQTVQMITEMQPDVLLLDLNMPVLDGFAVLEKFPKETRKFAVIILTNFEDQQNRRRGEELGVDDYFVKKEMTIKSLHEKVEKFLKEKIDRE